jgi:hypothetical protein
LHVYDHCRKLGLKPHWGPADNCTAGLWVGWR